MSLPEFTPDQIAQHASENDCWVILGNEVWDITDFVEGHPGGKRILMTVAGKDATAPFKQHHNVTTVLGKYRSKFVVGTVRNAATNLRAFALEDAQGHFGDMVPMGDPAWYQGWRSPYYKPSHHALRSWVRTLVETELMPHCLEFDEARKVPMSLIQKFGQVGYLSGITGVFPWPAFAPTPPPAGIKPEEWDPFHEMILGDELARVASSGISSALTLGPSIALPAILHFANDAIKQKTVREVLLGDKIISLAITEPYAGSDVANIQTTAVKTPDGQHYIVSGEKKWITTGMFSDFFITAVRTGKAGMGGISLLLLEKGMKGLRVRPVHCQGNAGSGTAYVMMDKVKVPCANLIGKENQGFKCIMMNFNHERMGIVVGAIRQARVCYEEAMRYANKRKTFGQKLVEHGVIRNKLGHMARQIEATQAQMELVTYQLCHMTPMEASMRLGGPIALLKAQSSVVFEYCAREASQILGGVSYTKGGVGEKVERLYRDVRGIAIPGGSEEIMLDLGIRQALKVSEFLGAKL